MNNFCSWLLPTAPSSLRKLYIHSLSGEFCIYPVGSAERVWERHPIPAMFGLTGPSTPCIHSEPRQCSPLLLSPVHSSRCSVCHRAAPNPVHGNVQLPQRGMPGNPPGSVALEMIICNHSHIPAKELPHTHLGSSQAAACDNHSFFNDYLKSLRIISIILCLQLETGNKAHHPLLSKQATNSVCFEPKGRGLQSPCSLTEHPHPWKGARPGMADGAQVLQQSCALPGELRQGTEGIETMPGR